MKPGPGDRRDLESLPPALRALLDAELAAGNEIAEVGHSFPAPPAGAYIKLARKVSTRPRATGDGLDFHDRHSSLHSGEFTDAGGSRFYFILEPPDPPPPEPDMDAIRDAADRPSSRSREVESPKAPGGTPASHSELVERFRASLEIDYERWHDGVGYAIDLLPRATAAEREEIEDILLRQGVRDWRDVEALAALDTPRARAALRGAIEKGNSELTAAIVQFAPSLLSSEERAEALVQVLEHADFYGGLTQALQEAETFHPPEVVHALLRGILGRRGEVATHFAALLMFIHGQAREPFDWDLRPYFLEFAVEDGARRRELFRDLCGKIGIDPDRYLRPK